MIHPIVAELMMIFRHDITIGVQEEDVYMGMQELLLVLFLFLMHQMIWRKELRVSDEEHRKLLSKVNTDDIIWRIREWRQAGGLQTGMISNAQPEITTPSPTVSASWKRQKSSQSIPSLTLAVITDYNPIRGLQALVYDIDMYKETWEWINLKEICPEDIRWEVEEDQGIILQSGQVASHRGVKRTTACGGGIPGSGKYQKKKYFLLFQNSIGKKSTGKIEILETDTLTKEVEKLLGASHPDPLEIEKPSKYDASDGKRV
ncbi:hypothetical protein OPV22_018732 [Ensete ventricosum]|uniref:ENT domain-containing protein n=1 Tax=Ensete ventricosum TaxID=4639 RepID=A0AAV8R0Z0_ENSVE|nr:hypothetical protein OPV22_018732 [Ensete ventricosum]